MAFKVLVNGGSKSFSVMWFNSDNEAISLPEGTTFSAFTSDFSIATAAMAETNVVLTPKGTVTGNVVVNLVATLPTGQDVYASILVHVTTNVDETTDYGIFQPI